MINNNWYTTLNKSKLTPPGYIFSIVWTIFILYHGIYIFYVI